jgi:hypothetical protein
VTPPVQVLVVGFENPTYTGGLLAELARLREAGIVRLVDLVVVERGADGALETVELPDHLPPGLGSLLVEFLTAADDPDAAAEPDPAWWSLSDAVPEGAVVAVALLEHLWAEPLQRAIAAAGGATLEETWLAPDDVERLHALASGG